MAPITASTVVDRPPEVVFDHLDDLANHAAFIDHYLVDFRVTSERSKGVGATARMRAKGPTRHPDIEITAVESVRPERTVEQGRGGKGMRRRSTGTYSLAEAPGGATHVTFELEVEPAGLADRLQWPITRAYLRRANQRALERLKEQLEAKPAAVR